MLILLSQTETSMFRKKCSLPRKFLLRIDFDGAVESRSQRTSLKTVIKVNS